MRIRTENRKHPSAELIRQASHDVLNQLQIVALKGQGGTFVSRHEAYGVIAHRLADLQKALSDGDLKAVRLALVEVGAQTLVAIASIDLNAMEW